ncbi:MAG: efflux RND transporter permease subunit [Gammaproteobacteria bacterium]|nr:efflux RND transporter permease subunit [Gammaproteobacteria bacterium]
MLRSFLENHVLANITFAVILVIGFLSYLQLPRSQDPEINFNWISVITSLPGASAEDVEKLVTDPIEDAVQQVSDVKFVSSNSREGLSSILIRFEDISDRTFDKRINDLRREIQNKANTELPQSANDPSILEITTANGFPSAIVAVSGNAKDELLRKLALGVKEDIEHIKGVDDVNTSGLDDPELQVDFYPEKLRAYGITATQLADSIAAQFNDISAGNMRLGKQEWLVRLIGRDSDPVYIARLPVISAKGNVPVEALADVSRGREKSNELVLFNDAPAIMMSITKKGHTNTLKVVEDILAYIEEKNKLLDQFGVKIVLIDDQTQMTRDALDTMQSNAILGLLLVALVTWVFLGWHIAFFIGIGIPFTLAGTFLVLGVANETLNQSVLLAIVIVLGMLVDDAVVVVEAIYYRLQRGAEAMDASIASLKEVFKPVTSSVLTTIAVFMPLMLLPGILGDFMFVIPFVVSVALMISLIEAYWMLPVHISSAKVNFRKTSKIHNHRIALTRKLRSRYGMLLVKVLRKPRLSISVVFALFCFAIILMVTGAVNVKFFAFDPLRLFYVNVEMPPGSSLEETLNKVSAIEKVIRKHVREGEVREMASVAGQMITESAPFFGDVYGQVMVSLNAKKNGMRGVVQMVEDMRVDVMAEPGPDRTSFLVMSGGPPTSRPISIKVRGDSYEELRAATDALTGVLKKMPAVKDISDDDTPGKNELQFRLDADAVRRLGLHAADVARIIRLYVDGEIVASMQDQGEKLEVRVRAKPHSVSDIAELYRQTISLPQGGEVSLGQLVKIETAIGKSNVRHYNFRRAITLEADLDKDIMDTIEANNIVIDKWDTMSLQFPNVNLDFSGELDDIQESLDSMLVLFLFGLGVVYLILGTQFKSYWQPFMILATMPMAFTGVVYGLAVTNNPLSLFTLYGVVALVGISVNAAIVMIDAANTRLNAGMSVLHATVYAARRRVVPIVITSMTTIAGLFSLATGLGGKSLVWGPVASAIVWGLAFSTILTLFVVPLLYRTFMKRI